MHKNIPHFHGILKFITVHTNLLLATILNYLKVACTIKLFPKIQYNISFLSSIPASDITSSPKIQENKNFAPQINTKKQKDLTLSHLE